MTAYRKKLERFAENFSFVSEDSNVAKSLVDSISVLENVDGMSEEDIYQQAFVQLKKEIKKLLLFLYQNDQEEFIKRLSSMLSNDSFSFSRKAKIFFSTLKVIGESKESKFYQDLLEEKSVRLFFRQLLIYEGDSWQIRPEFSKLCKNFEFLLEDYQKTISIHSDPFSDDFVWMVEKNQGLVWRIAFKWIKTFLGNKVDFDDLFQEGNIGLMKAIERFDPARGVQFSTYAYYWIEQKIRRYLKKFSFSIRIPDSHFVLYAKILKEVDKLIAEKKREPSIQELAQELQIPENKIIQIYKDIELRILISLDEPTSKEQILQFCKGNKLDFDEEDPYELNNFIVDDVDCYSSIFGHFELEYLFSVMETILSPREFSVLCFSAGVFDEEKSCAEIGQYFSITCGRVYQINNRACKKLKDFFKDDSCNVECAVPFAKKITFQDVLNSYSIEESEMILSLLTEKEKELLKLRYGEDYQQINPSVPFPILRKIYDLIYCEIPKRLYLEKRILGITNTDHFHLRNRKSIRQKVADVVGEDQLYYVISQLSKEDLQLLQKMNEEGIHDVSDDKDLQYLFDYKIPSIVNNVFSNKKRKRVGRKPMTVRQRIAKRVGEDHVDFVFSRLSQKDQDTLKLVGGESLDEIRKVDDKIVARVARILQDKISIQEDLLGSLSENISSSIPIENTFNIQPNTKDVVDSTLDIDTESLKRKLIAIRGELSDTSEMIEQDQLLAEENHSKLSLSLSKRTLEK